MRKQGNWNRDILLESQSILFKGVKVMEDRGVEELLWTQGGSGDWMSECSMKSATIVCSSEGTLLKLQQNSRNICS